MNSGFTPFRNFILNSCHGSKIKLGRAGTYMLNGFTVNQSIPVIGECRTEFLTPHGSYAAKYLNVSVVVGAEHGAVTLKDQIMGQIHSHDLGVWNITFQGIYFKDTPQYAAVWPYGHTKLHQGSVDEQLVELLAIIDRMVPYPLLDTLRLAMTAKYTSAFASETSVGEKTIGHKTASEDLNTDYEDYGDIMFKLFGKLVHFYGANAGVLGLYIDVEELQRKPEDNVFDKVAVKAQIDLIAIRTRLANEVINIINNGTEELKFYVVRVPGEARGIYVTVPAGATMNFARSLFGNMDYRYFVVENDSLTTNGHYILTFPN